MSRGLGLDLGEGCWLTDASGQHYLDASGGAAVSCLGHSAKPVLDAICQQLQQLAYAHTSFFTTEPAEQLADLLVRHAQTSKRIGKCWLELR